MTLADYRGIKRPRGTEPPDAAAVAVQPEGAVPEQEAVAPRERAHPGPAEYAKIGLALAIITAIEVAVYYLDVTQGVLVGVLVVLSAIKFSLVALWFMHLRFDSRVFSTLFVGGLALALAIFIVALATLGAGLI